MKSLWLLVIGVICLASMSLAKLAKADYPIGVIAQPIPACDVVCTELNLRSVQYDQGILRATVEWATNKVAEVKLVLVAAPAYYNEHFDPTAVYGDEKYVYSRVETDHLGLDPLYGPATMYPDRDPGYHFIGWDCRVYIVRTCDNTIMGWSNTFIVAWE